MNRRGFCSLVALAGMSITGMVGQALAQDSDQQELVDRAALTVRSLSRHEGFGDGFNNLLSSAKAVVIVPKLVKGGFILGGEIGEGVFIARTSDGGWGSPAFIRLAAVSIGFQIGGSVSEVAFTVMTDKGVNALLANQFKFGVGVDAALGPVGGSVEAATTTELGADIYAFATSQGLFAGGALDGTLIDQLEAANSSYYGGAVAAKDVIFNPGLAAGRASTLREALAR
ncbi:MAG: lipid-binding SYLF domain-containing protein [Alphaproteobacteria bacterium]